MSNKSASGGVGFGGLLTIVFIVLKLTNVIDWPWWSFSIFEPSVFIIWTIVLWTIVAILIWAVVSTFFKRK